MELDALGLDGLPQKDFMVISPVLVDPATAKKVNVGDGFILDSALRLIGARPSRVISSRLPISEANLEAINAGKLLLVAGANTLKSRFEITPNFTPALLDRIKVPVVLCGIGHYGVAAATAQPLDAPSQAVVREILRRFPYISVRCDASRDYLVTAIPDLAEQVLMTSCPVVHAVDGIDRGFLAPSPCDRFVFTLTDRAGIEPQLRMMRLAVGLFPARRRVLALHQDYGSAGLADLARSLGYEVFASPNYLDFLELYRGADLHVGNRVHAHLKCLSLGVRSFLTPFDLRQVFFARSLDFPLVTEIPTPLFETYDFGRATARILAAKPRMTQLVTEVRSVLDAGAVAPGAPAE
jgi:hypothetical protein